MMIQPTQVSTAAARRTSHDDTTTVREGGILYALATALKTAARTTKRFTRVSMLMLLLGSLMVIVIPQPAFAATSDHFAIGTFECPGNQMGVRTPAMSSLYGDVENAMWWPVIQKWNGSAWVTYRSLGAFNGVAGTTQTSNWHFPTGQPNGGSWYSPVAPGSWSGGTYYPTYYRVVNYVSWRNINDQALTGWYGPYISDHVNGGTMCSF